MSKLRSSLFSTPHGAPMGLRHFYSRVYGGFFQFRVSDTVGRLFHHLPEQYIHNVNLWGGVSWLANTCGLANVWAQNSCCDSTVGPCKPCAPSWPFARHTTHTELRHGNMSHASYMQIISQKVVRGSPRCRWSSSLLVQTRFRCTQVGGGLWCTVKAIPIWISAEIGLWRIVEILSTRSSIPWVLWQAQGFGHPVLLWVQLRQPLITPFL